MKSEYSSELKPEWALVHLFIKSLFSCNICSSDVPLYLCVFSLFSFARHKMISRLQDMMKSHCAEAMSVMTAATQNTAGNASTHERHDSVRIILHFLLLLVIASSSHARITFKRHDWQHDNDLVLNNIFHRIYLYIATSYPLVCYKLFQ